MRAWKRGRLTILVAGVFLCVTAQSFGGATVIGIPLAEREALIDLYNSTNGAGWTDNTGWLGDRGTECSWRGVTCKIGNTTVTRVWLPANNLVGTIPPALGDLANLQQLYLQTNQLAGTIPPELGTLAKLEGLGLWLNQLSGPIPPELGSLPKLQILDLHGNQLVGLIPPELGNISTLKTLELSSNKLSSAILPELGNLVNLQVFRVSGNMLGQELPSQLLNLTGLLDGELDLRYNGVFSNDPALIAFLNQKQDGGDWQSTQTINATNLSLSGPPAADSITLAWTPILYTADDGGYLVVVSTSPGGPFNVVVTTPSKNESSAVVTGLTPDTLYYIYVVTVTSPHIHNQNWVRSPGTPVLSVRTALSPLEIVTSSPLPDGIVSVPYTVNFAATGGRTPYSWGLSSGSPPPGLTLSSTGALTGAPSTSGSFNFVVGVSDSAEGSTTKAFDLTVGLVEPIPTLDRGGLAAFLVLLIAVGVLVSRRRLG